MGRNSQQVAAEEDKLMHKCNSDRSSLSPWFRIVTAKLIARENMPSFVQLITQGRKIMHTTKSMLLIANNGVQLCAKSV